MNSKEIKRIERVFKGVSNHWRIRILELISQKPDLSLDEIVEIIKGNYQTIAEHVRRLYAAGLVTKKYQGRRVIHRLSPYGEKIIKLSRQFIIE